MARLSVVVAKRLLPPLAVLSAPHAGTPPETLSTWPVEPIPSLLQTLVAEPYKISPVVTEDWPVPPTLAARVDDAETTPVALVVRRPEGEPETVRFVVLAVPKYPVPETERAVEEAKGNVLAIEVEVAMKY